MSKNTKAKREKENNNSTAETSSLFPHGAVRKRASKAHSMSTATKQKKKKKRQHAIRQ